MSADKNERDKRYEWDSPDDVEIQVPKGGKEIDLEALRTKQEVERKKKL
jgi:flagellar hook assembly protein FlgD